MKVIVWGRKTQTSMILKGTVRQAIQVLISHPVKYVHDVIICCVLLHHATKWRTCSEIIVNKAMVVV